MLYNLTWRESGGRKGDAEGGESGREEKGLTDGERQIDKEKEGLVLSQFYFTTFRLASEPHQALVIIPCQLARNRVAFCEGVSLLSDNYQHNEKATFLLLCVCALLYTKTLFGLLASF